jgi:hypothetical protein
MIHPSIHLPWSLPPTHPPSPQALNKVTIEEQALPEEVVTPVTAFSESEVEMRWTILVKCMYIYTYIICDMLCVCVYVCVYARKAFLSQLGFETMFAFKNAPLPLFFPLCPSLSCPAG